MTRAEQLEQDADHLRRAAVRMLLEAERKQDEADDLRGRKRCRKPWRIHPPERQV